MKRLSVCIYLFALLTVQQVSYGANPIVRIMPLGDSLTSGNYLPVPIVEGGFRTRLFNELTANGYNVDFVGTLTVLSNNPDLPDPNHEGHGGFKINDVDAGLENWLTAVGEPDVILLLIGTNDFTPTAVDPSNAKNRLDNLISHIATLRPYAKIIVANLPPRTDGTEPDMQVQTLYNPFIPTIVANQASLGRSVYFVDIRSSIDINTDMADALHPNPTGYNKIADAWLGSIMSIITPTDTATRTLAVKSVNPQSGVAVTVSPADKNGASSGSTAFTRAYANGTLVSLTAPATAGGNSFQYWETNGVYFSGNRSVSVTLNASRTLTAVFAPVLAPKNVPEAANYKLVYSLSLPNQANYNTEGVPYEFANRAGAGTFNRIAYYLELQKSGQPVEYIWVSMDAFTSDVNKIGVPSTQTGAFFQQNVTGMNVVSSIAALEGTALSGGNIEFYSGNYDAANFANVPNASGSLFDWGDHGGSGAGYGAMQVHNHAAREVLFAFNNWGPFVGSEYTGGVDLGIGNFSGVNPDWTYADNASTYVYKKLQVYVSDGTPRVLTVSSMNPSSGVTVTVSPQDLSQQGSGTTSFSRSYWDGTTVNLTAPAVVGQNQFQKWLRDGVDYTSSRTLSMVLDADCVLTAVYTRVAGVHVFYNNSAFDKDKAAANADDDAAIATDKTPLLPGGQATFANYTSFLQGINGIMVDIVSLPGTPTASDFAFKVGNNNSPSGWAVGPTPSSVTVRRGAGVGGSDRITLIWGTGNAASKQWLEVQVLANARTGLASPYVFYFGNAIGETGTWPLDAKVDASDQLDTRANQRTLLNPAPVDFPFDFDRDKQVDARDQLIARGNQTSLSALRLIDLSGVAPAGFSPVAGAQEIARSGIGLLSPVSLPDSSSGMATSTLPGRLWIELDGSNRLMLNFEGDGRQHYRLQSSGSLDAARWVDLDGPDPTVGDGLIRWTIPMAADGPQCFYRAIVTRTQTGD